MEYCALGDLSFFIKRRDSLGGHRYTRDMIAKYPNPRVGALNEVVVRHFLKQLSSALRFLRDRNLIHRDIKPQNLLLCPSPISYRNGVPPIVPFKGSDDSFTPLAGLESLPMLKIADFGFARSLPSTSLAETLCGSPLYMAPEILRYEKYDAKADLWSVGTVLYEMVVGKPPFRASNHVELLRKIEKGEDKIKFPEDNEASSAIKQLIRSLLKRNPVERMTFKDFFENTVVKDDIPGLVSDDMATMQRRSIASSNGLDQPRPGSRESRSRGAYDVRPSEETGEPSIPVNSRPSTATVPPQPVIVRLDSESPLKGSPISRVGSRDKLSIKGEDLQRATVAARRPATSYAPARQELIGYQSPTPATDRQGRTLANESFPLSEQEDKARDEREQAAQDIAFERDYVVVEKLAVEVNAFADELANSPQIRAGVPTHIVSRQASAVARRATLPTSPTAGNQASPANAIQVANGRVKVDTSHHRQGSYERRYAQSPSATSAISRAINMATDRLFGVGFSPPLPSGKGGRSPPLGYSPYPAYPAAQGSLMIVDSGKSHPAMDEDTKTVQVIEECATRSDVVYGFAEVKYKQLIPLTPYLQTGIKPSFTDGDRECSESTDGELTPDAVVTLSEEALVLYVKALALLAKSMDIAGAWWVRKNRGEVFSDSKEPPSAPIVLAGARINNIVQWVRNRFNEVLEKAEFVRLKLIEGQKRLPLDHPSHPNNHPVESASAGGLGTSADNVVVSSGITAEKLMYDRALEMSRAAAINELTGEDPPGCEIAYVTAIRMLEAVLENDEVARPGKAGDIGRGHLQDDTERAVILDGVQIEDRKVVMKRRWLSIL